jgi:hypothetical protein
VLAGAAAGGDVSVAEIGIIVRVRCCPSSTTERDDHERSCVEPGPGPAGIVR